jgi:hypothetical protein
MPRRPRSGKFDFGLRTRSAAYVRVAIMHVVIGDTTVLRSAAFVYATFEFRNSDKLWCWKDLRNTLVGAAGFAVPITSH